MGWKSRWFGVRSQQAVAERAAEVIDQVIFDLGAPRLVQGTLRLDPDLRPRFNSSPLAPARHALAWVALARLPEAAPLSALDDRAALEAHTAALVAALLREFRSQSRRFRALREHA